MNTMTVSAPEDVETKLQKMLLEIDDLPSIPETLMEILKVLDDPDSGPGDLGKIIRLDAPLMARILRLANSPYYSSRGDISDISRCVTVLGYRTVRQVAICVSVATSVMESVAEAGGQLDYRELWRHSVVTGAISKYLALMAGFSDPEEMFTAGLLHDMGKFILEIHAPEIYWQIIRDRNHSGHSLIEMEEDTFGFDHCLLGQVFGRSWRFPEMLTRCCAEHHSPLSAEPENPVVDRAVAIVALADYLANTLEPSRADLGFDPDFCDVAGLHTQAGISMEEVETSLVEIRDGILRASSFLDLS